MHVLFWCKTSIVRNTSSLDCSATFATVITSVAYTYDIDCDVIQAPHLYEHILVSFAPYVYATSFSEGSEKSREMSINLCSLNVILSIVSNSLKRLLTSATLKRYVSFTASFISSTYNLNILLTPPIEILLTVLITFSSKLRL